MKATFSLKATLICSTLLIWLSSCAQTTTCDEISFERYTSAKEIRAAEAACGSWEVTAAFKNADYVPSDDDHWLYFLRKVEDGFTLLTHYDLEKPETSYSDEFYISYFYGHDILESYPAIGELPEFDAFGYSSIAMDTAYYCNKALEMYTEIDAKLTSARDKSYLDNTDYSLGPVPLLTASWSDMTDPEVSQIVRASLNFVHDLENRYSINFYMTFRW